MKKRLMAGLLAAGMVLSSATVLPQDFSLLGDVMNVQAGELGTYENGFYYSVYGGTATINSYDGDDSTVTIPSTIGGVKVTAVGAGDGLSLGELFGSNFYVTKVIIPEGVTKINRGAFNGFSSLTTVEMPSTVTEIGNAAFIGCRSLTSINFPSGLKTIGDEAFGNCGALKSISLPSGLTTIGTEAFNACTNLTAITVPKSVTTLGDYAVGFSNEKLISNVMLSFYSTDAANDYITKHKIPTTNYKYLDSSHIHNWNSGVVTTKPTCTSKGVKTFTCTGCGATYTESVSMIAHDMQFVKTVAPTTTEQGYDLYKCSGCGLERKQNYTAVITVGDISKAKITGVAKSYKFTGQPITPTPTVTITIDGKEKTLVRNTDYTVRYSNNTTITDNAQVIVDGKGNYEGSTSFTFAIVNAAVANKDLKNASVTGIDNSYPYTGSEIKPVPVVKYDGTTLTAGKDYTVSYANNVKVGNKTASVSITGIGGYTGVYSQTFSINALLITNAEVSGISQNYAYTGSAIKPVPTVKLGGKTLVKDTDYTLTYGENKSGSGSVTITGKGNYKDSKTVTFSIVSNTVSLSNATVTLANSSYTYTGSAIKPAPTVKLGGKTLTSGTDYTVSYSSNTNAGTAKVTVTGKGNYSDSKSASFTITAASIGNATVSGVNNSYSYTGSAITPAPVVKFGGKTLTQGTEYTLGYSNNVNAGSTATITITGKGNFKSSKSVSFTVTAASLSNAAVTGVSSSYPYTGSAIKPAPVVKVNGKTLVQGTDYTLSYSNNVNAGGTATITITGKGNYKDKKYVYFNIAAQQSARVPGDADGNGKVDVSDVLLEQQKIAGWSVTINMTNADYDGSGQLTVADVLLTQQKIAGWSV